MHKILIVDDDQSLCEVLSDDLAEIGFDTSYVTNADDALKIINSIPVDLILLDLKMPEKDGFWVLKKLRELEKDIKVIVLTAFADVKSAIDSANLGANDFISKPYDLDELLISIRKVLQIEEHEN